MRTVKNLRSPLDIRWTVVCLGFAAVLLVPAFASEPDRGVRTSRPSVGGVSFDVPKSFGPQVKTIAPGVGFLRHREYDLGLVVAVREPSQDEAALLETIGGAAAKELFPKETAAFRWKRLPDDDKAGDDTAIQGFDGNQRVMLRARRIVVKEKRVLVGYVMGM